MANYNNLKAGIDAVIKTNGRQEISGAALNTQLKNMIAELGAGYQYMGVATPATNPGTPDANVFYLASEAGTYTNFRGIVINDGEVCALVWNGTWTKQVTGAATADKLNQLGQEITEIKGYENYTFVDGKSVLKTAASSNFRIESVSGFSATQEIEVIEGEQFEFYGYLKNPFGGVVALVNNAKQDIFADNVGLFRYNFTIPTGCTKIIASSKNTDGDGNNVSFFLKRIPSVSSIFSLEQQVNKCFVDENFYKVEDYTSDTQLPILYSTIKGGRHYSAYLKAEYTGKFTIYTGSTGPTDHTVYDVSADYSNGVSFEFDVPAGDYQICIRTHSANVHISNFVIFGEVHAENDIPKTQWHNKNLALYGDSITAICDGDFSYPYMMREGNSGANKSYTSWGAITAQYHHFKKLYGRGIGSQRFAWVSGGGAIAWVTPSGVPIDRDQSSTYENFDERLAQGLTNYPAGVTAQMENDGDAIRVRGSGCSWLRITQMFPESIKDSIDVVTVMFFNDQVAAINEENSSLEWVENSTVDPEWSNSTYYSIYGGDYNIYTIRGGIASTIMKIQAWMPNAIIILMTPNSGYNAELENIHPDMATTESCYVLCKIIREMHLLLSIPLIDNYANDGINGLNRNNFLESGGSVHPYPINGNIMLARSVIGGLNGIMPWVFTELKA